MLAEYFPVFMVIESTENRAIKPFPELSKDSIDRFPQEFDDYYSDNFKARNQLLKFNSKIKYHWFNIPPFSGKAFLGRQGWMYAIEDEMDLYLGNNIFSKDTLLRFIEVVNYRKHILDSIGCKYYLVIVPVKASVYPEYIPFSKRKTGQSTLTDQIITALNYETDVHVIDLRDELVKYKHEHRVFDKTDTHWNEYGGYVAYHKIMEELSKDFPAIASIDISEFKIEPVKTEGKNLTNMMGIIDGTNEIEITCRPIFDKSAKTGQKSNYPVPGYFPYKKRYEQVFVTPVESRPKLLAIHDSYGFTLIPFLNEHFIKSVFIFDGWQHALNAPILYNEKPDIFLQLVSEPLLPNIPKNSKKP